MLSGRRDSPHRWHSGATKARIKKQHECRLARADEQDAEVAESDAGLE